MDKKLLCIDMDDVIFVGGFHKLICTYLNKELDINGKSFYLQDYLDDKDAFFKFFFTKNLYDYCNIPDNCCEVMEKLNDLYRLRILTAYLFKGYERESSRLLVDKHNALLDNFPFLKAQQFIFADDKSVVNSDIMIDDKLSNMSNAKRKLLYTAYHNKNVTSDNSFERVDNWKEIGKKLILK